MLKDIQDKIDNFNQKNDLYFISKAHSLKELNGRKINLSIHPINENSEFMKVSFLCEGLNVSLESDLINTFFKYNEATVEVFYDFSTEILYVQIIEENEGGANFCKFELKNGKYSNFEEFNLNQEQLTLISIEPDKLEPFIKRYNSFEEFQKNNRKFLSYYAYTSVAHNELQEILNDKNINKEIEEICELIYEYNGNLAFQAETKGIIQ